MMRTSYHNHTAWSDGASSVAEMIDGARRAGLEELGISDHFALAPDLRRFPWAMASESLDDYVAQIEEAKSATEDLTLRLGLEVDYFPETLKLVEKRLAPYRFDYLIGSVHFVDGFAIDLNAQPWEGLSQYSRNRIWRLYWQRLGEAADSGLFDIIGHFDLPKKFNFHPSVDLTEEGLAVLDIIAARNLAIEINSSGWDKPVQEAYPSLFYLREANRRGIPLVINSDAHSCDEVARNFERARGFAAQAGYGELVRFEKRKRSSYPL